MISRLFSAILRRLRPRIGWPQTILAFGAAIAPTFAASESTLRLPVNAFFWAGVLGLALGLYSASHDHQRAQIPQPVPTGRAGRIKFFLFRSGLHVWRLFSRAALGALLALSATNTLPPLDLALNDSITLLAWGIAWLGNLPDLGPTPFTPTIPFLAASLPRLAREMVAAPAAGENGARLIVAIGGTTLTWAGALALGSSLPYRRPALAWGLPLLAALAAITTLGDSGGTALALGMAALLALAFMSTFGRFEENWQHARMDYSSELGVDTLMWGILLIGMVLLGAWVVPLWPGNPIARAFVRDDQPSGLAVLSRNIERPRLDGVQIGISALPSLLLGESLEQGPPERIALRIRVNQPLPESPWPRYWRVRLLHQYSGSGWSANASISPQSAQDPTNVTIPGTILQEIEDLRSDKQILVALPDPIIVSIPTNAERLDDGMLTAITGRPSESRYLVLSRLQEQATLPRPEQPPDMSQYLRVPVRLPPRVPELARALSGDQSSTYDQALAIERYLRALPYSYRVEPLPRQGDAVDQFLFEMRSGYCTYYASAMTVLARSLEIPARMAVGYSTGTFDPATSTYVIRESDAHAWPELYIDQRWVPFEPTPIRPLPNRATAPPPAPEPVPEVMPAPDRFSGPLIWLAVLVFIGLVTGAGWWWSRRPPAPSLVARAQIQLERYGARAGVPWPAGATLQEYASLLAPRVGTAVDSLYELIALIELARYSGRELQLEENRRLQSAGERLWKQIEHARGMQPEKR